MIIVLWNTIELTKWKTWTALLTFAFRIYHHRYVETVQCVPKNCAPLCGYYGGDVYSVISVLHSLIGQASTKSLRPCSSQSDTWLLIYGTAKTE